MDRTKDLSLGHSIWGNSERMVRGGKGGARIHRSFATKGRALEPKITVHKRKLAIARNLVLFCVWADARVWA